MIMAFFVILFFLFTNKDVAPVYEEKIDKKAKHVKNNKIEKKKTSFDYKKYLPVVYFLLVPILFIVMIYTQTGQNVFVWYLFFVLMSVFTILFALKYEEVPSVVLQSVAGITLVLIYICNFYTQSRGGYLGFGVGFVFFILLAPRKILFDNWKPLSVLMVALFSITLFTSINPAYSPFERFAGEIKVSSAEDSQIKEKNSDGNVELSGAAGSRGETWKSAFGIIADNPIFGIGPETLKMVFPRYETDLFRFKEAFHVKQDRSHNETFDVPVTKGLISFFIYIAILFLVFKEGIKKQKNLPEDKKIFIAGTLAAIASYLIQNQFSFGVVAITSLFWVLWAFVVNIDSEPDEKNDERKISFDDIPWIPVGCLVLVFLVLGYVSILQFEADKEFKIGKTYMDMRRFNEAFPYFKKAIAFFPFEGGTVTHYAITLLNGSLPDGNKTLQDEALKTFEYGMKIDPYNADNFYISSRIYLMRGDLPKAIDYTSKALKIDPYYAEAYLTLAMISENQKNFPQAQKYYEEAYRLNPNLNESKIKVAFKLMQEGKLDEAFNLLQEMVIANPQNIDVRNALATVYLRKGNLERAKEEFLQVLQIDPNNAYAKNMIRR